MRTYKLQPFYENHCMIIFNHLDHLNILILRTHDDIKMDKYQKQLAQFSEIFQGQLAM
jgi:hypothetical protein